MNAVVYVRTTVPGGSQDNSLAAQLRTCMAYAEKQGYKNVRVFQEVGEQAKSTDRPELNKMLACCEESKGGIEGVIVPSADRISRNVADFAALGKGLKHLGTRLLLANQGQDDTPEAKFFKAIEDIVSEYDDKLRAAQKREQEYEASGRLH